MQPTQLSITQLILHASVPVQFIMVILFAMFCITLFITGQKFYKYKKLRKKMAVFDQRFWSSSTLESLYGTYQGKKPESIERIFCDGFNEFLQFNGAIENADAVLSNCRRAMEAGLNRELQHQESQLGMLASFGSSAPYIGLLGTVYGIMTSFIAIGGATEAASLTSVAPGIAEALIATGFGLFAAIPSVLSYNYFIAESESLAVEYEAFIEDFSNLLQRQIIAAQRYQQHPSHNRR